MPRAKKEMPDEMQEAFATALIAEDLLLHPLAHFGITDPMQYASIVELTQAALDGEVPRYAPDPMLPGELWAAWRAVHDAGTAYDAHYLRPSKKAPAND